MLASDEVKFNCDNLLCSPHTIHTQIGQISINYVNLSNLISLK